MGKKFRVLEKNYTQKTKFYMVHTLFLTDSQNFNPMKYTPYMVFERDWNSEFSFDIDDVYQPLLFKLTYMYIRYQ